MYRTERRQDMGRGARWQLARVARTLWVRLRGVTPQVELATHHAHAARCTKPCEAAPSPTKGGSCYDPRSQLERRFWGTGTDGPLSPAEGTTRPDLFWVAYTSRRSVSLRLVYADGSPCGGRHALGCSWGPVPCGIDPIQCSSAQEKNQVIVTAFNGKKI